MMKLHKVLFVNNVIFMLKFLNKACLKLLQKKYQGFIILFFTSADLLIVYIFL